jgi:hypothetical protein
MNGTQLGNFLADPVTFLNPPAGKNNKGVPVVISGADGDEGATTNVAVANAPAAIRGVINYATFPMIAFPAAQLDYYLAINPDTSGLNIAKDPQNGFTYQTVKAFYLNWKPNKGYWMKLTGSPAVRFFFTARMNGCGVLIYGLPTSPTVVHANVDMNNLLAQPGFDNVQATKEYEEKKKAMYRSYYLNVAAGLSDTPIFQAASLSRVGLDDSGASSSTFDPSVYYKFDGSFAHVFGIRDSVTGNWTFYWHMTKQTLQGTSYLAGRLWPTFDHP